MRWIYRRNRNKANDGMSVYIITDSHLNDDASDDPSYPNLSGPPMYFYTARQRIEEFVGTVNLDNPDLVLHLGDVVDGSAPNSSYDTFMGYWNTINSPSYIAPGNHDAVSSRGLNAEDLSIHDFLAWKLKYEGRPIIGHSKFNESFSIVKNNVSVKFINLDTNIDPIDGSYTSPTQVKLPDETIEWLEGEIANSVENDIVMFSHKGGSFFDEHDLYGKINQFLSRRGDITF